MKAAVVSSFGTPPRYEEFPALAAAGEDDMIIDVIAAGLHPRVRSQADGSHYTSTGELPLVPGINGVGRGADGLLRYFILPDTTMGAMAEQTLIDIRRSIVLPEGSDPIAVAAAMNPAMSSWVALRQRIQFQAGQKVLVLGATGNAGQMAVQIANLFGAARSSPPGAPPAGWPGRARRHRHRAARGGCRYQCSATRPGRRRCRRRDRLPLGPTRRRRDGRRRHWPRRSRQAAHLDRDRVRGRTHRADPLSRAPRRLASRSSAADKAPSAAVKSWPSCPR